MANPEDASSKKSDRAEPPVDFFPSGFAFAGPVPEGVEGAYEPSEGEYIEAAQLAIRIEREALDRREAALEPLLKRPPKESEGSR
jgi:hypothetical protein